MMGSMSLHVQVKANPGGDFFSWKSPKTSSFVRCLFKIGMIGIEPITRTLEIRALPLNYMQGYKRWE